MSIKNSGSNFTLTEDEYLRRIPCVPLKIINIHMKQKLNFIIACVFTAIIVSCGEKEPPASVEASSTEKPIRKVTGVAVIEPQQRITELYTQGSGVIKEIAVGLNATFETGDVLLRLYDDTEQAQLKQAQTKYQSQLRAIKVYMASATLASTKLIQVKADLERGKALLQKNALTKEAFEDLEFDQLIHQQEHDKAKAELMQQSGLLEELQAEINYYEAVLAQKEVVAPFPGTVMNLNVEVGNAVDRSTSIGQFIPDGPHMAIVEIDELYASLLKVGLQAYVRTQGTTDTLQHGKVVSLSPGLKKKSLFSENATNLEDRRVREAHVLLQAGGDLLVGSKVECILLLDGEKNSLTESKK